MSESRQERGRKKMKPLRPLYMALFYVCWVIAQVFVRLIYPVKGIGQKNLPKDKGYVLAPNHLAAIDPLYILLARGARKKMLIMGKEELFNKSGVLNFFWNVLGAFPVKRGTGDKAAVEAAVAEVRTGRGLLIFPEGTRSADGELGRLKSGAFVVAMQAEADIVPCRIYYAAGKPKPFRRITVAFGAPVSMRELGLEGEYSPAKLRQAKTIFVDKLEALARDNNIVPQAKQPGQTGE